MRGMFASEGLCWPYGTSTILPFPPPRRAERSMPARLLDARLFIFRIKIASAIPTMATPNAMATTVPEMVSLSFLRRQMGFPAVSSWQITPGAHVGEGVTVGAHPSLVSWAPVEVYEQNVAVTIFVTEHCNVVEEDPVVWGWAEVGVVDAVVLVDVGVVLEVVESVLELESVVVVEESLVEESDVVDAALFWVVVVVEVLSLVDLGFVALVVVSDVAVVALFLNSSCAPSTSPALQSPATQAAPFSASASVQPFSVKHCCIRSS